MLEAAMAGTALLPWEEWLAQLLHPVFVAIRRWSNQGRHRRDLARSANWAEAAGTVHEVKADFSNPRERIDYFYSTERGYYSGSFWHWFDRANPRQVRVEDRIVLRYDPADHEQSVFLQFPN
jgi:hypothetical protein